MSLALLSLLATAVAAVLAPRIIRRRRRSGSTRRRSPLSSVSAISDSNAGMPISEVLTGNTSEAQTLHRTVPPNVPDCPVCRAGLHAGLAKRAASE